MISNFLAGLRAGHSVGIAMVAAAGLSVFLTPTDKVSAIHTGVDLERLIPKRFADWHVDNTVGRSFVNPEVREELDRIYNQTLSRTYINSDGERIMLAIAYGSDQRDSLRVHRPEVCYTAQGFRIVKQKRMSMELANRRIPVKRLESQNGARYEPITYWIKIGDRLVGSTIDSKLAQLKYGLAGQIPDGLLFRVSNIDRNADESYELHERFVNDLLYSVSSDVSFFLVGRET